MAYRRGCSRKNSGRLHPKLLKISACLVQNDSQETCCRATIIKKKMNSILWTQAGRVIKQTACNIVLYFCNNNTILYRISIRYCFSIGVVYIGEDDIILILLFQMKCVRCSYLRREHRYSIMLSVSVK